MLCGLALLVLYIGFNKQDSTITRFFKNVNVNFEKAMLNKKIVNDMKNNNSSKE